MKIERIEFGHGPDGVTKAVRDIDGRDGSFQYLHIPVPKRGRKAGGIVPIFSTLRQIGKKSGVNDEINTIHPKP